MAAAPETGAHDTGVTTQMQHHGRHLGRLIATVAVVVGLAACGGAGFGAGGTGAGAAQTTLASQASQPSTAPDATQPAGADAGASPMPAPAATATPAPTAASSLDLPDLSGVSIYLGTIDTVLADDASAVPAEGSDK